MPNRQFSQAPVWSGHLGYETGQPAGIDAQPASRMDATCRPRLRPPTFSNETLSCARTCCRSVCCHSHSYRWPQITPRRAEARAGVPPRSAVCRSMPRHSHCPFMNRAASSRNRKQLAPPCDLRPPAAPCPKNPARSRVWPCHRPNPSASLRTRQWP